MESGVSRAQANRRMRQDALREYLQERGSLQHLFDLLEKVDALEPTDPDFDKKLAKLDKSIGHRRQLLDKYMPHLKASEITMDANIRATEVDMTGVMEDIESRHD